MVEEWAAPGTMAELTSGRLRSKSPVLEQASKGPIRDAHRRLLAIQSAHSDFLDKQIDTLSAEIARCLTALSASEPPEMPATRAGYEATKWSSTCRALR